MVFFVCSNCGSSLKKNQIEKHTFQCRSSAFSCIDCNKDFVGDDYKGHTKCVSEIERYSAKGWKPPANHNKGEKKQNEWTEIIQAALDKHVNSVSPACKNLLYTIRKHDNVPRKKPKFINFINNVARMGFNESTINEVWTILESEWKTSKQPIGDTNNEKTLVPDTSAENSVVKKMKSELTSCKESEEAVDKETVTTEELVKNVRKKRKKGAKANDIQSEGPLLEEIVIHTAENGEADKKEKKKGRKKTSELNSNQLEAESLNQVESLSDSMMEEAPSKKKRKKKTSELNVSYSNQLEAESLNQVESLSDSMMEEASSKKKKKKRISELNASYSNQLETESLSHVESLSDSIIAEPTSKKMKKKRMKELKESLTSQLEAVCN